MSFAHRKPLAFFDYGDRFADQLRKLPKFQVDKKRGAASPRISCRLCGKKCQVDGSQFLCWRCCSLLLCSVPYEGWTAHAGVIELPQ
jgi:hypothetical protein